METSQWFDPDNIMLGGENCCKTKLNFEKSIYGQVRKTMTVIT